MPIMSYLVYPVPGKRQELENILASFSECDVIPADNHDMMILVTDTRDEASEHTLRKQLETLSSLQGFAMVSGFREC